MVDAIAEPPDRATYALDPQPSAAAGDDSWSEHVVDHELRSSR
jgi:hypothetical protein